MGGLQSSWGVWLDAPLMVKSCGYDAMALFPTFVTLDCCEIGQSGLTG